MNDAGGGADSVAHARRIDAHMHLWDFEGHVYRFEDYLADSRQAGGMEGAIFVECRTQYDISAEPSHQPVGEARFLSDQARIAAAHGLPIAAILYADLRLGAAAADVIDALQHASGNRMCGLRFGTAHDPDPGIRSYVEEPALILDNHVGAAVREIARRSLVLDLWVFHRQLPELIAFADANADLRIVVDHVGTPLAIGPYAGDPAVYEHWAAAMKALAERPNVSVKLGGLGMKSVNRTLSDRTADAASLAEHWRRHMLPTMDWFGPSRCMFESNFPVDHACAQFGNLWTSFDLVAQQCSPDDRDALFYRTAFDTYRLDRVSGFAAHTSEGINDAG